MHEWALAEAIITAAAEIAEGEGLKEITEVRIKLGELQQVEPEVLQTAFAQLKTQKFKNAKFAIDKVKAELKCRICGESWNFNQEELEEETQEAIHFVPELAHAFIKCPKCGSPDFEIIQGRGIWLESIKGV